MEAVATTEDLRFLVLTKTLLAKNARHHTKATALANHTKPMLIGLLV
jgi:hypothetical protein